MKKYFLIPAIAVFLMSACKQAELDKANQTNDSLKAIVNFKDSSLYGFITAFDEVERNLDSVGIKQDIILSTTEKSNGELRINKKDRINSEIKSINWLMDKNKKTIDELSLKLKNSGMNNGRLAKTIATLTNQLAQKNEELEKLNKRLASMNSKMDKLQTSIDTLSDQNYMKELAMAEETKALHTSYYIVGTTKQLKEAGVIDLKGGLLGLGRTSKLSPDIDKSKLTRIDYTETNSIPVNGDNVKVISSHPSDSYKLEKDAKGKVMNLVIMNSQDFWATSKCLVIARK